MLVSSFAGSVWAWGSIQVIAMSAAFVVLLAGFVLVERRVSEPVIPLRLFGNRVFSTSSVIGFVVGFAMFGAITYLPLYMQQVRGASPTESGLRLLPMMVGLLLTSMGSGQIISRTGRYKLFPIAGCGVFTVGLYPLSRTDQHTGVAESSIYMFVLGVGLGMVMQVLVLAVQNAVDYRDLGTATSGATFFRSIGSSIGVAVFGTVFTARLDDRLAAGAPTVDSYASATHVVFLAAVPVALLAFALAFLLPEVRLRTATSTADLGEAFAMPHGRSSIQELEMALSRVLGREDRLRAYTALAHRAGLDLSPGECWMVSRVARDGSRQVPDMSRASKTPVATVREVAARLADRGEVSVHDDTVTVTDAGRRVAASLHEAQHAALEELLEGWSTGDQPDVQAVLAEISARLSGEARPGALLTGAASGTQGE